MANCERLELHEIDIIFKIKYPNSYLSKLAISYFFLNTIYDKHNDIIIIHDFGAGMLGRLYLMFDNI